MANATQVSDAARRLRQAVLPVVATVLMSGCWLQPGWGPHRTGHNPDETGITRANVSSLTEVWSTPAGDGPVLDPAVSTEGVHAVVGTWIHTYRRRDGVERWASRVLPPSCPPEDCDWLTTIGSPSVRGGEVLVPNLVGHGGNPAEVFDASTGARLDPLSGGSSHHSISVDGDLLAATSQVYCGECYSGVLWVADMADPSRSWSTEFLATPDVTAATFADDRVVLGFGDDRLVAYTIAPPTNCHPMYPRFCPVVWSIGLQGEPTTPVASDDGRTVYVGDTSGRVSALDASDGRLRWSARVGGEGTPQVLAPPTVGDGWLYVPTSDGRIYVFDAEGCGQETCAPVWAASTGSPVTTQAALAGGVLYVASDDGTVHAFDAAGCDSVLCLPVWEAATGSRITGAPTVALGTLLVGTADGRLVAYRPS